jgi:hypothetical protein
VVGRVVCVYSKVWLLAVLYFVIAYVVDELWELLSVNSPRQEAIAVPFVFCNEELFFPQV